MKEEEVKVEFHVKRQRVMYPKNGKYEDGEFAIVSVRVTESVKGDPKLHPTYGTITLKGNMPFLEADGIYRVIAREEYDEKFKSYGYIVEYMNEVVNLDTEEQQREFFSNFITERQIDALFETFDNPMEVIKNGDLNELCKVKGIGKVSGQKILDRFAKCKDFARAYTELGKYGLTTNMINKLCVHYGNADTLLKKINENPYILADEVSGIGFKKADEIAINMGIDQHSVIRGEAFITFHLEQEAQKGNSYVYTEDLMDAIVEYLGASYPDEAITKSLHGLLHAHKLWHNSDKSMVALRKYYTLERNIARELIRLRDAENNFAFDGWEEKIRQLEENQGWQHTDEQFDSIKATLEDNVVLITGLAGTGKTSSVKAMLEVLGDKYEFSQCALSGKAAVNLEHATGFPSSTIHRLLGYGMEGFKHNKEVKLPTDIVILDELSMVDAGLFYSLIQAIRSGAKLIMLGDMGQLESIGVGNIIYDLVECGVIKHCHLTKVHRQAAKSAIITKSKEIRESTQIVSSTFEGEETLGELQDLTLVGYKDNGDFTSEDGLKPTIELMIKKFKEKLKVAESVNEIMTILPTKSRGSSCYKMNILLQDIVLPTRMLQGITIGAKSQEPYTIYKGDKVINLVNDKEASYIQVERDRHGNIINEVEEFRAIYNGNMGIVQSVDLENQSIVVDFDGIGLVTIPKQKLSNIALGYCITTHKSQGSGVKYVICGIDNTHYVMLTREMVYTMITRAKKHCDLIFETKALIKAIKTTKVIHKQTFLPYFLNGTLDITKPPMYHVLEENQLVEDEQND